MRTLYKDKENKTIQIVVAIARSFKEILTINDNEFYNRFLKVKKLDHASQLRRYTSYNRQILKNDKIYLNQKQTDSEAIDIRINKEVDNHRKSIRIHSFR